jgi:hypothetical protein
MNSTTRAFASLLLAAATACAPSSDAIDEGSDLPFEEEGGLDFGKADQIAISLVAVDDAFPGNQRLEKGGRAIITSAASWRRYFGSEAPASVDFGREWVAFYGSGLKNTGGYAAEIVSLSLIAGERGLILATRDVSPGFDCIVTQAFTTPHAIVKFAAPTPRPTWAAADHQSETRRCGPSNQERLAELAASRTAWESARAAHGNSYTYSQVMSSFLGFDAETTFVVAGGVVVERHFKSQFGADVTTWSEVGAEVGSHSDEGHPVALVDDLYDECRDEVLTRDEEENFMNLSFDDANLLQTCTSFHRQCNDDCDRGPKLGFISFE